MKNNPVTRVAPTNSNTKNVNKKYADKILKQQKAALISIYCGQDILNRPDLFC